MRVIAIALVIVGLAGTVYAFLLYAGNAIPYQDATDQMLKYQARRATMLLLGMAVGAVVTGVGGWLLRRHARRVRQ